MRKLHPDYFTYFKCEKPLSIYEINCSEKQKSINEAEKIWKWLLDHHADNNSLIVNFGGGMISDLGGFAASTFKRGTPFINIPTTLLAMIDAAIGGKNGINFGGIKNSVGMFARPKTIFTDISFLNTLPKKELLSGFGELVKYALIGDALLWQELQEITSIDAEMLKNEWIERAASFKKKIIQEDPYDHSLRKILNFGHTVGHAIEALLLSQKRPISHGHAVALGIIAESHLAHQYGKLSEKDVHSIKEWIGKFYVHPSFSKDDVNQIDILIRADKKRVADRISVPLLKGIGKGCDIESVHHKTFFCIIATQ